MTDAQRCYYIAASAKPEALLIDAVGNVAMHRLYRGLPDSPQTYDLGREPRGQRKSSEDAIATYVCTNKGPPICLRPYEAWRTKCPYCGAQRPPPLGRGSPDQVQGNLILLDPAVLDATYAAIAKIDGPAPAHGYDAAAYGIRKKWDNRQVAQSGLRPMIALYAGYQRHLGLSDEEIYSRFWYQYGVDVATAMTWSTNDALRLQGQLMTDLQHVRVKV